MNNELNWRDDIEKFCSEMRVSLESSEAKIKEMGEIGHKYFSEGYLPMLYFTIAFLSLESVENILEIGTGYGEMAVFLSELIPSATIYTIDAPPGDRDYEKWAWRKEEKYMDMHIENMKKDRIVFIEKNSFFLPSMELPKLFELIWIDGGHHYPAIAWDIMFAYNRLKEGGFIFMHDYTLEGVNDVNRVASHASDIIVENVELLPSLKENVKHKVAWIRRQQAEAGS